MRKPTEFEQMIIDSKKEPYGLPLTDLEVAVIKEIFRLSAMLYGDIFSEEGERYRLTPSGKAQIEQRFNYLVNLIKDDERAIEKMDIYMNYVSTLKECPKPCTHKGGKNVS